MGEIKNSGLVQLSFVDAMVFKPCLLILFNFSIRVSCLSRLSRGFVVCFWGVGRGVEWEEG